jgi:hypothetical protein
MSSAMVGASQVEMMQRATLGGGGVSAAAGGCYLNNDDFTKTGHIVAENGVQLYVIHPNFSAGPVGDGIENLRGVTGAPLLHLQSNTEPGLQRILRETSGYYVATFESEPGERLGVAHAAELKVSRQGVEVRSRPWVAIGRTATARPGAVDPAPTVTTPMDMLRTARSYRDLPLRASAFPAANEGGKVNVIGLFEPADPSTKVVTAAATLYDATGAPKAYWSAEEKMLSVWPVAMVMTVDPGTYRMRVAAIDSNGRLGTVDDDIVVELRPAGPLQLSGLVLGLSREGRFTPRLQFSREATALAYVEIYGATPGMPLGIYFELITADGKSSFTTRGVVEASEDEKKFMATATIPIGALPPGEYVVRATVGAKDQPVGQVVRTLRKVQ